MDPSQPTLERRKFEPGRIAGRLLPSTLRGRFLVVLFGVLLPSLTLFGVLHHDSVRRSLLNEVDQTLIFRAREVEQALANAGISRPDQFGGFEMVNSALVATSSPEVYVEIISAAGELLWTSDNLEGKSIPVPPEALTAPPLETVVHPDGVKLRRLIQPLTLSEGSLVFLVLAESLVHLEAAMRGSIGRTVVLGLVVLTLTELLAHIAFRGVFYPLRRLVDTTETIVSTTDVTRRVPVYERSDPEIKRTALAFNALMERVEGLLEMAERLLADTSHELRNPLTVLMTDLDLLRQDLSVEQRHEVVSEAQGTVRKLNRLINDLLLLSRTDAHPEQLECEEVQVPAFVEKVVERFSRTLEGTGRVVLEAGAPPLVAALNRERSEQILTNLFENGIRYSENREVRVRVYQEEDQVVIAVADEGIGIPESELEKIFGRFYRIEPSRDRHSGGAGLGLAVARALARQQGSEITVKSAVGAGSEFQVRLRLLGAVVSGAS